MDNSNNYEHLTYRVPTEWIDLLDLEREVKDFFKYKDDTKVYKDILHIIKKRKMELHSMIRERNITNLIRVEQ